MISDAPLPPDTIGLADAFQRVCIVRIPEWPAIQAELEATSEALRRAVEERSAAAFCHGAIGPIPIDRIILTKDDSDFVSLTEKLRDEAQKRLFDAKTRADRILREALAARDIRALIRNPATGEIAEITNSNEWKIDAAGLDRPESVEYEPGFSVNHVSEWRRPNQDSRRVLLVNSMPEQPGPPSHFGNGVRCPVFLRRLQFEEWLGEQPGVPVHILPYAVARENLPLKSQIAFDVMIEMYGPLGVPVPQSMPWLAKEITKKYKKLGWKKHNTRHKEITDFNDDDVERVFGRRK